jgi:hypothetical protein
MRLEDELEPKLMEISRWATELFTNMELRFCTMPAALPRFFPRSVAKFDEARDRLDGLLARTGHAVDAAGVALVDAANAYRLSDEQAAEVIRQTSQMRTPSAAPEPARYGGV